MQTPTSVVVDIYNNVVLMLGYRGATLSGPRLSDNDIIDRANQYEYVLITATRDETDQRGAAIIHAVIIAPNSIFAARLSDFRKLLNKLPSSKNYTEVIIISEQAITTHLIKHIKSINSETMLIEYHMYELFECEVPKHKSVPPHYLATDAEIEEFCYLNYTSREKLPRIPTNDPMAIWLGLREGMCTRIERLSNTAGTAIAYRVCKGTFV